MTSIDVRIESDRPKIAVSANQCLQTFRHCLLRASSMHARDFSMVEDQVARFSTWSASIGIFAPERASADHRLRHAPEVYTVIVGLLESLHYRIQTCYDVLDNFSKFTSEVFKSRDEALERSLHGIATELSHLNKLSNVIRKASKEARDVRGNDFKIKNDDGDDVEGLLTSQFAHRIRDRFPGISEMLELRLARTMLLRRKRILYRRHRQERMAVQPQEVVSEPVVETPICQSREAGMPPTLPEVERLKTDVTLNEIAPSRIRSATTLLQTKFNTAASSPSAISASRTIPLDKHETLEFPSAPGHNAKQKYEWLKRQRLAAHQAFLDNMKLTRATIDTCADSIMTHNDINAKMAAEQAKLKEDLEMYLQTIGEVTCPYCLDALPAKEVFEEPKWRNHVMNDLEPYICLFEGCAQPDELYTHSDAWIGHLRQHGQYWRCTSQCESRPFSTREDYIQHLHIHHKTNLSDVKLRAIAKRNACDPVEMFQSCPLCGSDENMVRGQLIEHITGHLRSLALISLPSFQEEVPEQLGSDKNSFVTSQPSSRSTVKKLGDIEASTHSSEFWKNPQSEQIGSRNFLGNSHNWRLSTNIDLVKAENPSESFDFSLPSMLPQQEEAPVTTESQSVYAQPVSLDKFEWTATSSPSQVAVSDRRTSHRSKRGNEDWSDDTKDPNKRRRATKHQPDSSSAPRLACLFNKYDPSIYRSNAQTNKMFEICGTHDFQNMNELYGHLKRVHSRQPLHCPRCARTDFRSFAELQVHRTASKLCELIPLDAVKRIQRVTNEQSRRLRREFRGRLRGCTDEEKWIFAYRLLFPDTEPDKTPSPYLGDPVISIVSTIVDDFETRLRELLKTSVDLDDLQSQIPNVRGQFLAQYGISADEVEWNPPSLDPEIAHSSPVTAKEDDKSEMERVDQWLQHSSFSGCEVSSATRTAEWVDEVSRKDEVQPESHELSSKGD